MTKKILAIILIVAILSIVGFFMLTGDKAEAPKENEATKNDSLEEIIEDSSSNESFSFITLSKEGKISNYKIEDNKLYKADSDEYLIDEALISEDNSLTYTAEIKKKIEGSDELKEEAKQAIDKLKKYNLYEKFINDELKLYEDYIVYSKEIKKGEHVWKVQKELTGDLNKYSSTLPDLYKINPTKSNLHLVYPGEKINFLLNDFTKDYTEDMFEPIPQYEVTTEEKAISFDSFDEVLVKKDNSGLYIYYKEGNVLLKATTKDEKINFEKIKQFSFDKEIEDFAVNEKNVYFITNNELLAFDLSNNEETLEDITIKDTESSYHKIFLTKNNILLQEGDMLTQLSFDLKNQRQLDLLSNILDYQSIENDLYLLLDLGHKKNKTTIYKIELKDFVVEKAIYVDGYAHKINISNENINVLTDIYKESLENNEMKIHFLKTYDLDLKEKSSAHLKLSYDEVIDYDEKNTIYMLDNSLMINGESVFSFKAEEKNEIRLFND